MQPVAVIIAGGEGRRFWPLSRPDLPKQFLRLFGDRSLIQQTVERLDAVVPPERVLIATGRSYEELTREHLPFIPGENVICEPMPRNTAPALALASLHIRDRFGDPPVIVLPADHYIPDTSQFQAALQRALDYVCGFGGLLTFGIQPTRPEAGYGYIELGPCEAEPFYFVARFREKPPLEEVVDFLASGQHLWNSGMFAWRNESFLRELSLSRPSLARAVMSLAPWLGTGEYEARLGECFAKVEAISVDYAVMERAANLRVMKVDFTWDDVGSWTALERHRPRDRSGNVIVGHRALVNDARDCLIYAGTDRTVGVLGVDGLIVAVGDEGVLVAPKERAGEIRSLAGKAFRGAKPG